MSQNACSNKNDKFDEIFVDDFNEFYEICRSVGILSKLMIVMKFR